MLKLAVMAPNAVPPKFSATCSVADAPSRPRTFDSKHEDGGEQSSWDKRAC